MNRLEQIEQLLLEEFSRAPFHNVFMLSRMQPHASHLGGTCSDKVLQFKRRLGTLGIESRLHTALINHSPCHRLLSIDIDGQRYYIDVGSGWPSIHLFPAFEAIEYTVWSMSFKTIMESNGMHLYHKTGAPYHPMSYIPFASTPETEIYRQIENRYADISIYPFANSLRFSKVIDDKFIFLKGRQLREFSKDMVVERSLSEDEIFELLISGLQLDPKALKKLEIGRWI